MRTKVYKASHQSYEQAKNIFAINKFIPPQSKDICYWISFGSVIVNFKIDEKNFLSWASQKGWQLEKIDEQEFLPPNIPNKGKDVWSICAEPDITPNHNEYIKKGYLYKYGDLYKVPGVITFAYDKETGMGYFTRFLD